MRDCRDSKTPLWWSEATAIDDTKSFDRGNLISRRYRLIACDQPYVISIFSEPSVDNAGSFPRGVRDREMRRIDRIRLPGVKTQSLTFSACETQTRSLHPILTGTKCLS